MNDKKQTNLSQGGLFYEISSRFKLIMRLLGDHRVHPLLKVIPPFTLLYLISPIDMIPGIPLDDAGIVGLGLYLFVELCPPEVVQEHLDDIQRVIVGDWKDIDPNQSSNTNVEEIIIDGRFKNDNQT